MCPDIFKSEFMLSQHVKFDHERQELFECPKCDAKFKNKSTLKRHDITNHQNESKKPHLCPHCAKNFARLENLNVHIKSLHEKVRFKCELCDQFYNYKHTLRDHIERVHEKKIQPVQCSICNIVVKNLKKHIEVVHEKKKPYGCAICNAQFNEKYKLQMHIRKVHEGER